MWFRPPVAAQTAAGATGAAAGATTTAISALGPSRQRSVRLRYFRAALRMPKRRSCSCFAGWPYSRSLTPGWQWGHVRLTLGPSSRRLLVADRWRLDCPLEDWRHNQLRQPSIPARLHVAGFAAIAAIPTADPAPYSVLAIAAALAASGPFACLHF